MERLRDKDGPEEENGHSPPAQHVPWKKNGFLPGTRCVPQRGHGAEANSRPRGKRGPDRHCTVQGVNEPWRGGRCAQDPFGGPGEEQAPGRGLSPRRGKGRRGLKKLNIRVNVVSDPHWCRGTVMPRAIGEEEEFCRGIEGKGVRGWGQKKKKDIGVNLNQGLI